MNDEVKLFDAVALTADLPEYSLSKGQVGTVVELLKNGADDVGLRPDHFMVLHYEPESDLREPVSV